MQDITPHRVPVIAAPATGATRSPSAVTPPLAAPLPGGPVFVDDDIRSLCSRAHAYMHAGVPVHLRGPAGIGKTTLAHHIAARLGRPVSLLTGDHWLSKSDMIGREIGATQRSVKDSYIHSVKRSEVSSRIAWQDSVLTQAMLQGHTLIYDEFTRATPQANNTLLSVLEERVLIITHPAREGQVVQAHPDFRMIVTSNPDDYIGVNMAPDALLDRMVTFDLAVSSARTEAGIVAHRTGLPEAEAAAIVAMVRGLRDESGSAYPPSMRTAILIGRLLVAQGGRAAPSNGRFVQICLDVLAARTRPGISPEERAAHLQAVRRAIARLADTAPEQEPAT